MNYNKTFTGWIDTDLSEVGKREVVKTITLDWTQLRNLHTSHIILRAVCFLLFDCSKSGISNWLTDWQTDWLTGRLTDWLTGRLTDWLTDWLTHWLTDWLTDWLIWHDNDLTRHDMIWYDNQVEHCGRLLIERGYNVDVTYTSRLKRAIRSSWIILRELGKKHCIVLYCIVLYCIVLYCIVLYCIVLYCTILDCTVLYCTASLFALWHCNATRCVKIMSSSWDK